MRAGVEESFYVRRCVTALKTARRRCPCAPRCSREKGVWEDFSMIGLRSLHSATAAAEAAGTGLQPHDMSSADLCSELPPVYM
eukprot:366151-Chlamydomonas_euryale.AAC.5